MRCKRVSCKRVIWGIPNGKLLDECLSLEGVIELPNPIRYRRRDT